MSGGMLVAGLKTGTHFIEDIQVSVPHRTPVFIPAEKVLRSADLYRALGQNLLFKLDDSSLTLEAPPPVPDANSLTIARLEAENKALREQNAQLQVRLEQQMTLILDGMSRLEQRPVTVVSSGGSSPSSASARTVDPDAVSTDAPMFLPGSIAPKDAEAQIRVEKHVSEGKSVGAAGDKLRELRRKSGG